MDQRILLGAALAGAILAGTMGSYLLLKQRPIAPSVVAEPAVLTIDQALADPTPAAVEALTAPYAPATFRDYAAASDGKRIMDRRRTINEYYRCYRDRDLETLRAMLTPDFRHVSSFAVFTDRDQMLEEIWPMVGKSWARNVMVFGDGDEYMVKYEVESPERPPMSMAERLRFDGDKIAEIEVFMGRQLEQ